MRTPVTVGIVGDTDRSTALARAFSESPLSSLRWITDERSRPRWTGGGLRTAWAADFDTLLHDEELDAIVFASTAVAAQGRAREALEADKHVYIEGPLAFTAVEANELVYVAERRDRCLWAQSTPLLGSSTLQLRALVEREMLGEIFYLHATRFVRSEEAAFDLLWGVGVETVALALDLLGDEPVDARGHHESYRGLGHHDLVFAELRFATGAAFHMHLSCLEGDTVDRFAVVGSELTAVLDAGTPTNVATSACRRLTPSAKMIVPNTTAATEEFAARICRMHRNEPQMDSQVTTWRTSTPSTGTGGRSRRASSSSTGSHVKRGRTPAPGSASRSRRRSARRSFATG
jgi:predicted dehydrogenase